MKNISLISIAGLGILMLELLLGVAVIAYGTSCIQVREVEAQQMLSYIRETNPEYYARIQSLDDPTYRREFYKNYITVGDKRITITGFMFLLMTISNAIPLVLIYMMNGTEEEAKNKIPLNDETKKKEEVKKAS